jgi:hypothetical protein
MKARIRKWLDEAYNPLTDKAKVGSHPRYIDPTFITPAGITALCTAATESLRLAKRTNKRKRVIKFWWYGRVYKAQHTGCRLLVKTVAGTPVACRWD